MAVTSPTLSVLLARGSDVYVRTNYPMTAYILDHSPGVVGEPWAFGGLGGGPAVQTKGAIRDCLKGVTSNTPTGLYRLALHPSVVLLWPQLLRPAGRSLTVMRPSGLPSVPGSGFPRPRCYRGMTVGERLPEGSPRIDNGVTHHFGKKLLVSTEVHGVQSLPPTHLLEKGTRVVAPTKVGGWEWRCHTVPPFFFGAEHTPGHYRCQEIPFDL
jgi:hypothetical protein